MKAKLARNNNFEVDQFPAPIPSRNHIDLIRTLFFHRFPNPATPPPLRPSSSCSTAMSTPSDSEHSDAHDDRPRPPAARHSARDQDRRKGQAVVRQIVSGRVPLCPRTLAHCAP